MRNYLDTLLNLHPTQEEQDEKWETVKEENWGAFIDLIGFLIVMDFIMRWRI